MRLQQCVRKLHCLVQAEPREQLHRSSQRVCVSWPPTVDIEQLQGQLGSHHPAGEPRQGLGLGLAELLVVVSPRYREEMLAVLRHFVEYVLGGFAGASDPPFATPQNPPVPCNIPLSSQETKPRRNRPEGQRSWQ